MRNFRLKIVIYDETGDFSATLESLELNPCHADLILSLPKGGDEKSTRRICGNLISRGIINSFAILELPPGSFWPERITESLLSASFARQACDYLLFLSSSVKLAEGAIARLVERLQEDAGIGIVNPVFVAKDADSTLRIRHLGTVVDSQLDLHYLYWGLSADNELASRRRFFQLAHSGAALVRLSDFINLNGFNAELGELCWPDFCIRLGRIRAHGATTEPAALAFISDIFDAWKKCGLWNSLRRLGKLPPAILLPDFHNHALNDGLEYGLTSWLAEKAINLPVEAEAGSVEEAWINWQRNQDSLSLLELLGRLPPQPQKIAFSLCGQLAASLPRALAWYSARARSQIRFGEGEGLAAFAKSAREWLASIRIFHYRLLKPAMKALRDCGIYNCSLDEQPFVYDAWIELAEKRLSPPEVAIADNWPRIAILMPVYNPSPVFLREALDSVRRQNYGNWQLCIADDASTDPEIGKILRDYAMMDSRVKLVFRTENGHISRASQSALELVDAPWCALMDHDDALPPDALLELARAIAQNPDLNFIYTDEDKITGEGVRRRPVFKPDFRGLTLFGGHLLAFRTELLRALGGFRSGVEGAQDTDLVLGYTEKIAPETILHIPRVLYHWRVHEGSSAGAIVAKPYIRQAMEKVMGDRALRKGYEVEETDYARKLPRLALRLKNPPECCLVMLFDEHCRRIGPLMGECVKRMRAKLPLEILEYTLESAGSWPGLIPIFRKAAKASAAGAMLFIYAGLRPQRDCRPEQLLFQALRKDVAVAGSMFWKNGRLLNGGYYPNMDGMPFILLKGARAELLPAWCWGQFSRPRQTIGVAWQCLAVRRGALLNSCEPDCRFGPFAGVAWSLEQEKQGLSTMVSPWSNWDLPNDYREEEAHGEQKEYFLSQWGRVIKKHGLRNPNLKRAPDNDWGLITG